MKFHVLLGGRGPMAEAMFDYCAANNIHVTRYGASLGDYDYSNKSDYGEPIGIYFGSPEKWPHFLTYCERIPIPIILGSTKIPPFTTDKTIVIRISNLSRRLMRAMPLLKQVGLVLKENADVDILEAHPITKKDTSGTAREFAAAWGVPEGHIVPLRKRQEILALGVPRRFHKAFAYHRFIFSDDEGVEIELATRIITREPYASGAAFLARAFLYRGDQQPQQPGVYGIEDVHHLMFPQPK